MKAATRLWMGALLCVLLLTAVASVLLRSSDKRSVKVHSPELEYLKRVNSIAPPKDPELTFILMGEFASSNLQDEGAEFFGARLRVPCLMVSKESGSCFPSVVDQLRQVTWPT